MLGDREKGLDLFLLWYRESGLQMKGITFDQALQHYAFLPTFLQDLGASVRYSKLSQDRLKGAMLSLAAQGFGQFPRYTSFFDSLVGEVRTFRFDDAAAVVRESVSDIKTAAFAGAGLYVAVLAAGAVVYLFVNGGLKRAAR